jgi:RimJ/RimL family protein N-acetyltransferase
MERQFPFNHPARLGSYQDPRLHIIPFESLPFARWIELIERTYLDSDDVPELAAIRTTAKAVEGYRANRTPGVEGWFAIHCNGEPAGCLVLARHYHPMGEISYLGLAPEFRSQGYSFGIMQFAMEWMERQRCTKVALAVDCRNEVAMNVYQKWGFQATISYHAWVASPKTFQPSSSHR